MTSKHAATRQNAFAAVFRVNAGEEDALRTTLQRIRAGGHDVASNPHFPFAKLETVHFARFVVVDRSLADDGKQHELTPTLLLFASNYDGRLDDHLKELADPDKKAEAGSAWLHDVLRHCEGYGASTTGIASITTFFKTHRVPYSAFYVGAVGHSVARIRDEERLRLEIQSFLDQERKLWSVTDPIAIRDAIRTHLESQSKFDWALEEAPRAGFFGTLPRGSLRSFMVPFLLVVLVGAVVSSVVLTWMLLGPVLGLVAAALVGSVILRFRWKEMTDEEFHRTRYDERAQRLAAREDKIVQNQMSALVDIKSGPMRAVVLRTFLDIVNFLARVGFNKGRLGGIPTIHFARWIWLKNERSLVFLSNYSGSWEQYLGDFIDRASVGLTGVWSNTVLFPRTKWLIRHGARDEERFKVWARAQQIETDIWYSAYRDLSMPNILNNSEIRKGLVGKISKKKAAEWIRRL